MISTLGATIEQYKPALQSLGLATALYGLISDFQKIREDRDDSTSDATLASYASNALLVVGGLASIPGASLFATSLLVSATAIGVWSAFDDDSDIQDFFNELPNVVTSMENSFNETIDTLANDFNDVSDTLQEQYNDWMNNSDEYIDYSEWIADTNNAINVNDFSLAGFLNELGITQLENDGETYTFRDDIEKLQYITGLSLDELLSLDTDLIFTNDNHITIPSNLFSNLGYDSISLRLQNDFDIDSILNDSSGEIYLNDYLIEQERISGFESNGGTIALGKLRGIYKF